MKQRILIISLLAVMLMACTAGAPSLPAATTQEDSGQISAQTEESVTEESVAEESVAEESVAEESVTGDAATEDDASTESSQEIILVPTPKPEATPHPAEQLITAFTEPSQTNGDVLMLYGQVLDVNGNPVPETVVEIWQTDAGGAYDHPGDPSTQNRDTTFQFYGKAITNVEGWYVFRTILPGEYEPRPRHIHYKVKQNGATLLISQFYFSEDIAKVQGESMFRAVGDSGNALLLQLVAGDGVTLANGQIVVDTGIGTGTLALTPSQSEGPYYPVVDLAVYDNDLVRLP